MPPNIPTLTTPDSEFLARWHTPYYNPRIRPLPIPTARWDECPTWCLVVNEQWASHVLALLDELDQWDTWLGTDEAIDDARTQVNEFIACFMEGNMGCCCDNQPTTPVMRRVDPVDGYTLQVSYDGGETWITDPEDPRLLATQLPAPVPAGVSGTKCDAATNGLEHLKDIQMGVAANLGTSLGVIALAAAAIGIIVAFFFTGGLIATVLIPIIISLISAISSLTPTEYNAIFTNEVWDDVLCILYCHIGSDGHFNQEQFNAVLSDLQTELPGGASPLGAAQNVASFVKVLGLNGLNNICSYGNAADADCSSCDCICDVSEWVEIAAAGTIDVQTTTYVDVIAHYTGSQWQAGCKAPDASSTGIEWCCLNRIEAISGATGGTTSYCHGNEGEIWNDTAFAHCGLLPNSAQHINAIVVACTGGTGFTMRFWFDEPCGD